MTEIFDAERARRLAILRQSAAPNVIRINPDTASFLRRYEDADVSRLKLLEAQRLRQESEAEKQLIKSFMFCSESYQQLLVLHKDSTADKGCRTSTVIQHF